MCVCLVVSIARAELSVLIVLPGDRIPEFAPYETRLRSELLASGYSVMSLQVPTLPTDAELAALADRRASSAAILVDVGGRGPRARVWMRDAAHARILVREVASDGASEDPSVFAVRTTDVLHGGMLELGYPPRRPPAEGEASASAAPSTEAASVASSAPSLLSPAPTTAATTLEPTTPPPRATPEPAVSRRAAWHASVGASGLWAPGGVPFGIAPAVGVGYSPARPLSLELSLAGPVLGRVTEGDEGALVDQELGMLRVAYEWPLGGRVLVRAAMGGGVRRIGIRGRASAANSSGSGEAWSGVGWVGLGLRLELARSVALRGDLGPALDSRLTEVEILGQTSARTRNPSLLGGVALELSPAGRR